MKKSTQILAALLMAALVTGVPTAAYASESSHIDGTCWNASNRLESTFELTLLGTSPLRVDNDGHIDRTGIAAPMEKVTYNPGSRVSTAIPTTLIIQGENTLPSAKLDAMSMRFPTVVQTPTIELYRGDDRAQNMLAPKLQCSQIELYSDTGSISSTSMYL